MLIAAISFTLPCVPPLRAEIQALLYSILFFGRLHRHLILETDCQRIITSGDRQLHSLPDYSCLMHFLHITYSHLVYAPREVNMVAHHHLAQHARLTPITTLYTSARQLPPAARGFYLTDSTTHAIRT